MIASLVTLAVLGQGYARSHMSETDNSTQCLWWKEGSSIVYRQAAQGNAETPGETEFTAVNAAFATWQTELAACTSLSFSEGPRSTNRVVEYLERKDAPNQNLVIFRQRTCKEAAPAQDPCFADGSCANKYDCWQFSAGAIAITTTSFSPSNAQIFDSDIELNTPSYFFSTVDSPPCVVGSESVNCVASDVQNTMTHEIGHLLGLGHYPSDPSSTMAPRAVTGELSKRTLDVGSKKFLCDIYPKGKPSKLCFIPSLAVEKGPVAKTGCSSTGAELSPLLLLLARRRRRGR